MCRKALTASGEAEPVRRGRAHAHPLDADSERPGEPFAHLVANLADPRLLTDADTVRVDELPACLPHLPVRLPEEVERGCATVLVVTGREERADVAEIR